MGNFRSTCAVCFVSGFIICASLLFGCSYPPVVLSPDVGKIEISRKLPLEVGLLITEDTSKYIVNKAAALEPSSCGLYVHPLGSIFPLGNLLENVSVQAFSQVFEKVTLVRSSEEAEKFSLYIEPIIANFGYTYLFAAGCKSEPTTKSKVILNIKLFRDKTKIWERTVKSSEQWGHYSAWVDRDGQSGVGKSVSDAMISALKESSKIISEDKELFDILSADKNK